MIIYSAKTDCGLCRTVNQDSAAAFVKDNFGIFIVSDGMGGHSRGELASSAVAYEFNFFWQELMRQGELPDFTTLTTMVKRVILEANTKVYQQYNHGQVCGATIVVLLVYGDCYAVFSAGDSHVYTCLDQKLTLLTVDDIWDNLPSTIKSYTQEEIMQNERSGKLVQALGTAKTLDVHVKADRIKGKQTFLLCSDGLYRFCNANTIQKRLNEAFEKEQLDEAMEEMFREVFQNGAPDNVSAILISVK